MDIAVTLGWVIGRLDFSGSSSIFPSPVIPKVLYPSPNLEINVTQK